MIPYFSFPKVFFFNTWGLCVGLAFVAGLFYVKHRKDSVEVFKLALVGFLGAVAGAFLLHYLLYGSLGFVFYGGLFGGLFAGWAYVKDFRSWADLAAPAIALGIFIGRIGCFLINDHLGTAASWGILWPDGIVRHPVALYLSLNGLVLFFLLKRVKKNQFIFFLSYYALSRFLLDFLRVEPRLWGLTFSQLTSLIILAILVYRYLKRKQGGREGEG